MAHIIIIKTEYGKRSINIEFLVDSFYSESEVKEQKVPHITLAMSNGTQLSFQGPIAKAIQKYIDSWRHLTVPAEEQTVCASDGPTE